MCLWFLGAADCYISPIVPPDWWLHPFLKFTYQGNFLYCGENRKKTISDDIMMSFLLSSRLSLLYATSLCEKMIHLDQKDGGFSFGQFRFNIACMITVCYQKAFTYASSILVLEIIMLCSNSILHINSINYA